MKYSASAALNIGLTAYANANTSSGADASAGFGSWNFLFQTNAAAAPFAVAAASTSTVRIVWKFIPWTAAVGHGAESENGYSYGANDITVVATAEVVSSPYDSKVTISSGLTKITPTVATQVNMFHAESSLRIKSGDRTIWLDAKVALNALANNSSTAYIRLIRGNGYTLSGHDGFPHDWNDVF
jgi:hypothetical protein